MMIEWLLLILAGAIVLDLMIGDPRWLPHPVVGMGKLIYKLEQTWNHGSFRKGKGILLTLIVIGIVYVLSWGFIKLCLLVHPLLALFVQMVMLSTTIAIKGLKDAALQVAVPLGEGKLDEARKQLSMIVGRDTKELAPHDIARGAVETVAENTVDGITAPLFWFFIGGVPAAMTYRAINTLDSMVGYKNARFAQFGWASARTDDVVNWVPARLTAISMGLASILRSEFRARLRQAIMIVFRDAPKHPSPNSGWPEAMTAGLLGVALGGRNTYQGVVSKRATMGEATRSLQCLDIPKAILIMHGGWIGCTVLLILIYYGITLFMT